MPLVSSQKWSVAFLLFPVLLVTLPLCAAAQTADSTQAVPAPPHPLITRAIDDTQLTTLRGNTHPLARPEFDLGPAPASQPMQRMLLVLKRGPDQEAALRQLLDDQQDQNSPHYHKWLTPDQFGKQFGPTDADMQTITTWLQQHGFQVGSSRGRTALEFSGSASQVQEAFHTAIHKYRVNGEEHWANATDPQIPTALIPAVAGVASLNNFPRKAMNERVGTFSREKSTGKITPLEPEFTFPGGCVENNLNSNTPCAYGLGPYDFATIYDLLPLWNSGINGTGQTIAIVGESNINIQDVADFRNMFGLPVNNPNIIVNGPDPGIQGDESEADIDVEWSGAVAPNANIDFVVSQSTETTAGIDLSAVYIIDNNLASVMSESYGYCELGLGTAGNQFYNTLWQQAAAEGITVFISAGDNGAAGCDDFNAQSPAPAIYGLQVSGFASTPYNVAVGGTDFNDFSNPSTYWSTTNNSTTQASALSYIPETTWNDSCTNGLFATVGYSSNAEANCNNSTLTRYFVIPEGGSGGVSKCTTPTGSTPASCAGGYSKPSWQSGAGVPPDGKRDIPDVSLFASNGFLGNFYIVCQSDQTNGTCNLDSPYSYFLGFGGTSVSSPAFAGIMALVNQKAQSRQGNANYVFYKLATQQPTAFHDVTVGTIAMPCQTGSPNCTTSVAGDAYGVLSGYNAGTNYDLATGLGSVDANNLVTKWTSVTLLPSTTTLSNVSPTTITHGQAVTFTATVKPTTGTGTPTGTISLEGGPTSSSQGIDGFNLSNGTFTGNTEMLPGGTYSLIAHYPGDSTYGSSNSSPISVTVNQENSQPQSFLVTFNSSGSVLNGNTNAAVYGSPYTLRVNVNNAAGQLCNPVATTGATACPTGNVTLTNNGSTLDAGTYPLNSYGYVEDLTVQLPGGSNAVKASYAGDSSFNAASTTNTITITPASTTTTAPNLFTPSVGQSAQIQTTINTTSSGVAPSGTVTFYANGTALGGTTTYSPGNGGSGFAAFLGANITTNTSAFPTAGSYSITATYAGDTNYATSTSAPTVVNIKYPVPNVIASPQSQTVSYGNQATVTALVDTSNKAVYPTGTVTFSDANTGTVISGPTKCTNATDSSGNFACQATATFTVTSNDQVSMQYSGDSNFPSGSGYAIINMPDFNMYGGTGQINLTAGQSQSVLINLQGINGFTGTVSNFSCSGLPAEATCSFNPTQLTMPSNGQLAQTTLAVTTAALGQSRRHMMASGRNIGWPLMAVTAVLGFCFIAAPVAGRKRTPWIALMLIAMLVVLPNCGGSGGGGGGSANNPVPSITSLTPSKIAAGSQISGITINGTGFINGSTFTFGGAQVPGAIQSSTQINISPSASQLATVGQFPVVVTNPQPGGGSSSPVNFDILTGTPTGTFNVTVTASSGPLVHTTTFYVVVQ